MPPVTWKPVISATYINSSVPSYMVVTDDNQIWLYSEGTWSQPTNGACCALLIAADGSRNFYVTGGDQNVYHYNGNGYDKLNGPGAFTSLANGGSMQVWAIGPTNNGNNVYRFSDTGLQHV